MLRNLRLKLRNRYSRLKAADAVAFFALSKQFFVFFDTEVVLRSLGEEILAASPSAESEVDRIQGSPLYGLSEADAAAIGYAVFRRFSQKDHHLQFTQFALELDDFRDAYLQPFFDYLDERLDDTDVVLSTLLRFKHTCEWFHRDELNRLLQADHSRAEKNLAWRMYEYLYQQGIDFSIEPTSASGQADMVSAQNSDNPLIADAKLFIPESARGVAYLAKGLHQLYTYACDFNRSIGYLVVFSATERRLAFAPELLSDGLPRWRHNDKTIFVLVIDIFSYPTSASRRGVPETITVTSDDLVRELSSSEPGHHT
jgi:hypothetical protein